MTNDADFVRVTAEAVELLCPTSMPQASAFLWNRCMQLQMNCRGYATAQYLQPEPAKYSHPPLLEQKTFMQPEQPYFDHHPGRFAYIRDDDTGRLFSVPYAPVKRKPEEFVFSVGTTEIGWRVLEDGIAVDMNVILPTDDVAELWTLSIANRGNKSRTISVYPVFSIGYMSWMSQSARYDETLGAIVASSVTPYQKLEELAAIRTLKDRTFLLHDTPPDAWETSLAAFEGDGGLHAPDSLRAALLARGSAVYETPVAAFQYRLELTPGAQQDLRFVFGPARDDEEILALRTRYLATGAFESSRRKAADYLREPPPCLQISSPDAHLDAFVNRYLGRQVYYHGDAHRLTTDPQTRNFLQDCMGMVYVDPPRARAALLTALAQQLDDGGMPEGIVLAPNGSLKYINQVPHTDHCVWLPVFLEAWLDETGDFALLDDSVPDTRGRSVFDAVTAAMRWLVRNRDERRLSLIAQGDWCDPMNMVGPAGRGISGWLTMATVHALRLWARVCRVRGNYDIAAELRAAADDSAAAAQEYLWDGNWFARGISDEGRRFGISGDTEGRLYLNPQSWAILGGVVSEAQCQRMLAAIEDQLDTPYGTVLLAPAYTVMHDYIGRVTQKFPGTAENGSVYNHAVAFHVAALYALGESDRAYAQLRRAIPGPAREDYLRRGQLPVYLPNYYRGAHRQFPEAAGRSSHLCHTGAASWFYRLIIEQLFGLRGGADGLCIRPQLPSHWSNASATRRFRGAEFDVRYRVDHRLDNHSDNRVDDRPDNKANVTRMTVNGRPMPDDIIRNIEPGRCYRVEAILPPSADDHRRTAQRSATAIRTQ